MTTKTQNASRERCAETGLARPAGSTSFGRWIRAARDFHGVSLPELAKRASMSKGHLSKIENDPTAGPACSLATAEKLTRAFGMPLWQVLKRLEK